MRTITRLEIASWLRIDRSNLTYVMHKCTVPMPLPIRKDGKNFIYDYAEIEKWIMTNPANIVSVYPDKMVSKSLNRPHVHGFLTGLFDPLEKRLKYAEIRDKSSRISSKTICIRVNQEMAL